jgi:hypothetical protein
MYASANKNVGNIMAVTLAEEIVEKVMAEVNNRPECNCHGVCSCTEHWCGYINHDKGEVVYSPDHTGATVYLVFKPDSLLVEGRTCGGNHHGIDINLKDGTLTVSHDGARRSTCGLIGDFLPQSFWDNSSDGWKLAEYKTSESTWAATIALLRQKFGDGPTTLEEANQLKAITHLERIKDVCRQIGKDLPEDLYAGIDDTTNKVVIYQEKDEEGFFTRQLHKYKLEFTPIDRRRAAAVGVNLE